MMDNRAITEYKLIIKICDQKKCAEYDPFGLCYVDDCMSCPNSRIKIIREDGVVMRDDFKDNKNITAKDKLWSYKRMLERDGIELFEKMYNVNFSKWQKKYLSKIFNKLKSKKEQLNHYFFLIEEVKICIFLKMIQIEIISCIIAKT